MLWLLLAFVPAALVVWNKRRIERILRERPRSPTALRIFRYRHADLLRRLAHGKFVNPADLSRLENQIAACLKYPDHRPMPSRRVSPFAAEQTGPGVWWSR